MVNRFTTAQSTVMTRRWRFPAIVTLAALTALPAEAATRQARPAPPTETTAPRAAGEPIMAIVSIKTQHVTFYDADGWIVRAPVSTGTTGRETPAGVFAVLEKDTDHHSTMYDDAEMPNMLSLRPSGWHDEQETHRAPLIGGLAVWKRNLPRTHSGLWAGLQTSISASFRRPSTPKTAMLKSSVL